MKILIDADGCPVVDIAIRLGSQFAIPCLILCDTAHEFHRPGAETLVFDKGADSVDFSLVNRVSPGDIVITQDYGLASMFCPGMQGSCTRTDGNIPPTISILCFLSAMNPGNTGLQAAA